METGRVHRISRFGNPSDERAGVCQWKDTGFLPSEERVPTIFREEYWNRRTRNFEEKRERQTKAACFTG